ncbi:MAG: HD domain-containing protein [Puniceicoccales bacterium]|jgi:3'-5' exoribonuclease|nr:HD domain-containing protein [Puniceicoccales bacterium]
MTEDHTYLSVKEIKQLDANASFETVVLVRKVNTKVGRNGGMFMQVEVGDSVDTFTFNCFEGTQAFSFFQTEMRKFPQIVCLQGHIEFYADKLSPRVKYVAEVKDESYEAWLGHLLEKPEEPVELLKKELYDFINQIQQPKLLATVRQVFEDLGESFFTSVAAASMHHAYWHGLLEHSVHVTRIASFLLPLYPQVNKDLSIAGALLHDVGKVLEYRYESIEGIDRTRLGRLEGHVVLGYRLVRSAGLRHQLEPEWLERLEHILLSHQGEPEWGAAVYPSTPEAIFIALADNFDAKMAMVQQQLRKALPQQIFSDFIPGLQTRLMTQSVTDLH